MPSSVAVAEFGPLAVAGLIAVGVLSILGSQWRKRKMRGILDQWATTHGMTLARVEPRGFKRGPFGATLNDANKVYRVDAILSDGRRVAGWVRCKLRWGEFRVYDIDAVWDGEPANPPTAG